MGFLYAFHLLLDFPLRECPLWSKTCGLVGMWRILLKICWSAPDQHGRGGGSINSELRCCRWGERGGGGVDWQSSQRRSAERLKFVGGEGGEGREGGWSTVKSERICREVEICRCGGMGGGVDRWSTWKGSVKTLQGLPLTTLILGGGSIDGQLG